MLLLTAYTSLQPSCFAVSENRSRCAAVYFTEVTVLMLLAGRAAVRLCTLRNLSTVAAPRGLRGRVLEKRKTPLSKRPAAAASAARTAPSRSVERDSETRELVARIRQYGAVHKWHEVLLVVEQAGPRPKLEDAILYNTAIAAVGRSGQFTQAMELMSIMRARRLCLSEATYGSALLACDHAGQPDVALQLLAEMTAAGIGPRSQHYTSVALAFIKAGLVQKGLAQLQQWIESKAMMPCAHAYNRVVKALLAQGCVAEMLELFESARARGVELNVITYTYAALALGRSENGGAAAAQLVRDMDSAGITPNMQTYTAVW